MPKYRYEVGYEGLEAYDNTANFAEAYLLATKLKERDPQETIYVFDRMAHAGKAELWFLVDGDLRVMRTRQVQS